MVWKTATKVDSFPIFFISLLSQKKLIFDCAQAARAPSFSAARERRQRDRKGGSRVSPLLKPLTKAAAAGLLN